MLTSWERWSWGRLLIGNEEVFWGAGNVLCFHLSSGYRAVHRGESPVSCVLEMSALCCVGQTHAVGEPEAEGWGPLAGGSHTRALRCLSRGAVGRPLHCCSVSRRPRCLSPQTSGGNHQSFLCLFLGNRTGAGKELICRGMGRKPACLTWLLTLPGSLISRPALLTGYASD